MPARRGLGAALAALFLCAGLWHRPERSRQRRLRLSGQILAAIDLGLFTAEEGKRLERAEMLRNDAIQVDAFTLEDYNKTSEAAF